MTISLIIPVYNVKPYLRRCLDSVADESWKTQPIGNTIREKFKQPSIWEVRHG